MDIGIYKITCIVSGHFYIGQSKSLEKRWKSHQRNLFRQKHHNRFLQNVSNKYGLENLVFEVLETCDIDTLDSKEQDLLDYYIGTDLCMNIAKDAKNPVTNLPRTQEWNTKISNARKGQALSEETKAKISAVRKLQVFPEGCRDEYFKRIRGKFRDSEIGKKIAVALTGKKLSEDHVKSLINSHPGKAIIGINLEGFRLEFSSAREAAQHFNCTKGAIAACIRKEGFTKRPSAKLYGWKFIHKDIE
jgi:group I intron endonuclease